MSYAVNTRLTALDGRSRRAGVMQATPTADVHHAVMSMLPAVHPCLAAVDIKTRYSQAFIIRASSLTDVYHTLLSMLLAVLPCLSALGIEARVFRAGGI